MKRSYSTEYLLSGILILGVAVWCLFFQRSYSVYAAGLAIVGGANLYRAFSPRYIERSEEDKAIGQELFGRLAPFMEWGPVAGAVVLMLLSVHVPEDRGWMFWLYFAGILLMGALALWYTIIIERHRKKN